MSDQQPAPTGERLQKVLAAAGWGSRRSCEELIVVGRVEVNRQTVTELGTRVDADTDEIRVDGEVLKPPRMVYLLLNKPSGVVCTHRDPQFRLRVFDLVPDDQRLFSVGRLDRSSEGLILLTNDGEFANLLAHPRYGVQKTYRVRVAGLPTQETLQRLRRGIHLAEGMARVTSVHIRKRFTQSTEMQVELREGKNREIRRILARIGHKVMQLKRVSLGPLQMEADLPPGAFRPLKRQEIAALRQASRQRGQNAPPHKSTGGRKPAAGKTAAGKTAAGKTTAGQSARHQSPRQKTPAKLGSQRRGRVIS